MKHPIGVTLAFGLIQTFCLSAWAVAATPGRIALVQYDADAHFDHYDENRANLTRFADEAVAHQANLIVFPEGSSYGYGNDELSWCAPSRRASNCLSVATVAEQVPSGPSTSYWAAYSRAHQVYVFFNLPEADAGLYFNTTVVVGPEGYVAKYRKRALFYIDQNYATAGDAPLTLDTPYGKLGLLTCMDVTYPGDLEDYKNTGADAAILMMDWDEDPRSDSAASQFIASRAQIAGLDVYAADVSNWDGSGKYFAHGGIRERNGLPASAIGQDGISYHELRY
jgi:predicted amidohydrolase